MLKIFKIFLVVNVCLMVNIIQAAPFSIIFNYLNHPPQDVLHAFNYAVVQPYSDVNPKQFDRPSSQAVAYVSVGEISKKEIAEYHLSNKLLLTKNPSWKTEVFDQNNPATREFLLQKLIKPLWERGYRAFFFDTLDSYQLAKLNNAQRDQQIQGLIKFIQEVKKQYPEAKIILNRGFELVPQVKADIFAVAAESLFEQWNQDAQSYGAVPVKYRDWLLKQLNQVKQMNVPVIAIDYVPADNIKLAEKTAQKIMQLGFVPWVGDHDLNNIGVGVINYVSRKILMLYDSREYLDTIYSDILRFGEVPVEYYGYLPVLVDLKIERPPAGDLRRQYAGIVIWSNKSDTVLKYSLSKWLQQQIHDQIPVVILGDLNFGLQESANKILGLQFSDLDQTATKVTISKQTKLIGFETPPPVIAQNFTPLVAKNADVQLQLKDQSGLVSDVVAYTPWGGYAFDPYVVTTLPNNYERWVINPMVFFKQALKLKEIPVPDVTTQYGRRLMMVHIDGDGFSSRSEFRNNPFSGKVLLDQIFIPYHVPTTFSVIEAELSPSLTPPKQPNYLMRLARKIYTLPNIQAASHTFSHPFKWKLIAKNDEEEGYNLKIPGYTFNVQREITGSVDFIDKYLLSHGKKCNILLWSGDCNPMADAVGLAYKDHLLNMNGGDTTIKKNNNTLTAIAPLGVFKGKYLQIFAPNQNENVYTNDWTGPFYGYRHVIETFELTNKPYRFKPIDIYYHCYSATKYASLEALKQVYDWALSQPVNEIFSSQYIVKVMDYYHTVLAKQDGGWLVTTDGHLNEIRVPTSWGYPDLDKSKNIIGFDTINNNYYIHMGPGDQAILYFNKSAPTQAYLQNTNAQLCGYEKTKDGFNFCLESLMPVIVDIHAGTNCYLSQNDKKIEPQQYNNGSARYHFPEGKQDAFREICHN